MANLIWDYIYMGLAAATGALTSVLYQKKAGSTFGDKIGHFFMSFGFGFIAGAWATQLLGLGTTNNSLAAYVGALVALAAIPRIMAFGKRILGGDE